MKTKKRITAALAALALTVCAAGYIPAQQNPALCEPLTASAEMSKDGKTDASDAAFILAYSAALGAGETTLPMDEWMQKKNKA